MIGKQKARKRQPRSCRFRAFMDIHISFHKRRKPADPSVMEAVSVALMIFRSLDSAAVKNVFLVVKNLSEVDLHKLLPANFL